MRGYEAMRDRLRTGEERFLHFDAAQLVKHAFGLVTEGGRRERSPVLFYLFAEPAARNGQPIAPEAIAQHRDEISRFAKAVAGNEVTFSYASYRQWLATWPLHDSEVAMHRKAIIEAFAP